MRRVVEGRQPVIVERDGRPHVVVVSVEQYEQFLRDQPEDDWRDKVQRARDQVQADLGVRPLPPPERVLTEIREERDAQLAALR